MKRVARFGDRTVALVFAVPHRLVGVDRAEPVAAAEPARVVQQRLVVQLAQPLSLLRVVGLLDAVEFQVPQQLHDRERAEHRRGAHRFGLVCRVGPADGTEAHGQQLRDPRIVDKHRGIAPHPSGHHLGRAGTTSPRRHQRNEVREQRADSCS